MQHAKKMILMPQDAVEKCQRSTCIPFEQPQTVQTPGNILSRLDAEMDEILRSVTPANEREKWKLYQQVLQRYQFFTDENRRNTSARDGKVNESEEATAEAEEEERIDDETIIASVPAKYRKQAEQLLKFLKSASVQSQITWDKIGAVTINGERIKDANIIDLVNDAMRHRKTVKAIGRSQFGTELRRAGVPREFVGNHSLLYENLTLSPPQPAATPQTSFYATRSNQSTPNSSKTISPKLLHASTQNKTWKTLNI